MKLSQKNYTLTKMERLLSRSESHFMGLSAQQELEPLFPESEGEQSDGGGKPQVSARFESRSVKPSLSVVQRLAVVDSQERHWWLLVQLVALAYFVLMWPIELAFLSPERGDAVIGFAVADYLCDALFIADLVLQFLCREEKKAMLQSAWFWVDVLAMVPADVAVWHPVWLHFVLRANRLLRLARAREYAFEFERFSARGRMILVIKLALSLLFISNAFACAYVGMSFLEGFSTNWGIPSSYASAPLPELYFQGFTWAWQVISRCGGSFPGPTTVSEKALTMLLGLVVLFLGAIIIGEISGVITTSQLKQATLAAKLRAVSEFASSHKLPRSVSERLVLEVNSHWNASQHEDFAAVLRDCCSSDAQAAVAVFLHKDVLRRVPLFASLSHDCIKNLAVSLKARSYQPNEFIVREGDKGSTMYFVDKGTLEALCSPVELGGALAVYSGAKTGKDHIAFLGPGDFFGESSLLDADTLRNASVRTVTAALVFELTGKKLRSVLRRYPAQMAEVELIVQERRGHALLRSVFYGFGDNLIPLFKLRKLSRGDSVISCGNSEGLCFAVSGEFEVRSESGNVVTVMRESGFFGSSSDPCDYSVTVKSEVAYCFVLAGNPSPQDAAMLQRHERHSIAYFEEHAARQKETHAAELGKCLGKNVTEKQIQELRENGFASRLLDVVVESSRRSEMHALKKEETKHALIAAQKLTKSLLAHLNALTQ